MASILALASHYFAAFVIIPEAIWLIILVRPRLQAFAAASAVGAVGFALLPLAILQEGAGHPDGFTKIPVLERTWESVMQFASSYSPSYSSNILSSNTTLAGIQVTAGAAEIFLLVAAFMI